MDLFLAAIVACTVVAGIYRVDGQPGSYGTYFIFTFPNKVVIGYEPFQRPNLIITSQNSEAVTVSVSVPGIDYMHTTYVPNDKSVVIGLPREAAITGNITGNQSNKTVIVTATYSVSVHGYSSGISKDGFIALPTEVLDNDYIAVAFGDGASEFVISAIHDNTNVSIAGDRALTLQQNESYQYIPDDDPIDVTGISISANKPISVMSGHMCAYAPYNTENNKCDYLMENIPPVSALGHHYILADFLGRNFRGSSSQFRVIPAVRGTTKVTLSYGYTAYLPFGESYYEVDVKPNEVVTIAADNPVMVAQYAMGTSFGAPFMIVIPPTQAYSGNVTFPLPIAAFVSLRNLPNEHYLSIITACDNVNSLLLDDQPLDMDNVDVLRTPEFCVIRTLLYRIVENLDPFRSRDYMYSVTHPSAEASFLVLVYGSPEGYGYVAGYDVHSTPNFVGLNLTMGCIRFEKPNDTTLVPDVERYNLGQVVTVNCNKGFVLIDGNDTLTCLSTGLWYGQIPRCSKGLSTEPNSAITIIASTLASVYLLSALWRQ